MQLNKICHKIWKLWGNLTNSSETELYGLQYIGGYVKKLKIAKAKSTTNQFILSKRSFRSTCECENKKTNSELLRGGLWFSSELLQKILTITERCFSGETLQHGICRIWV